MLCLLANHEERGGEPLKRLTGKTALITGGASGIGQACIRFFIEEAAWVVVADIVGQEARRLASELGREPLFVHTDVDRESEIEAAVNLTVTPYGRLDCIINTAGAGGVYGGLKTCQYRSMIGSWPSSSGP
jgi:NAD(P)-dependent dehydrogenase (short-subunit alcohol dehydrogenase family)